MGLVASDALNLAIVHGFARIWKSRAKKIHRSFDCVVACAPTALRMTRSKWNPLTQKSVVVLVFVTMHLREDQPTSLRSNFQVFNFHKICFTIPCMMSASSEVRRRRRIRRRTRSSTAASLPGFTYPLMMSACRREADSRSD